MLDICVDPTKVLGWIFIPTLITFPICGIWMTYNYRKALENINNSSDGKSSDFLEKRRRTWSYDDFTPAGKRYLRRYRQSYIPIFLGLFLLLFVFFNIFLLC